MLRHCPLQYLGMGWVALGWVLSACAAPSPAPPQPTPAPSLTPSAQPSPQPSPTPLPPTASPTVIPSPAVKIREQPGSLYETLFSIPVGAGGVTYRGGELPDMEINGPNALAFTPEGNVILTDPVSDRLFKYELSGQFLSEIDLLSLDIVNVIDLRASQTELVLLEVGLNVAPPRFRVHRLSFEGDAIAAYEIPQGFRLEDGLSGIAVDCEGEIFLELEGGFRLYRVREVVEKPAGEVALAEMRCWGRSYRAVRGVQEGPPLFRAGDLLLTTQLTLGLGGLNLVGVLEDGSVYMTRDDVVASYPAFEVDRTIHLLDAQGRERGVARLPLKEYAYFVMRSLAIGPDGLVYALIPRAQSVDIVRLNFYRRLEPLLPEAAAPVVSVE